MLFDNLDAWLERNPEVLEEKKLECAQKFDCPECESSNTASTCISCDGTGLIDNPFFEIDIREACRLEYCAQLEKDYRRALHMFCAA